MSEILNKGGIVDYDGLVYDATHPIDAKNIAITVNSGETKSGGAFRRGQVIDINADGTFGPHAADGTPAYILAEDASYASDDTTVVATAYISGAFRESKLISAVELKEADKVALQEKGIFLK